MDREKLLKANEVKGKLDQIAFARDFIKKFKETNDTPTLVMQKGTFCYPIEVNRYLDDSQVSSLCYELIKQIEEKMKKEEEELEKEFEEL